MTENIIRAKSLVQGQTEVGISKFGPFFEHEHISRTINLPAGYGKDRIVAMVRDPWWIFVYWEITPQKENELKNEIARRGQNFERPALRVYNISGVENFNGGNANNYFDIPLKDMAKNWYIDMGFPNNRWCIEIGMLTREGNFYRLARSNIINTPRFGMSDILDKAFILYEEEYLQLFGASCGIDVVGKSSLEMRGLFQRYLKEWIFSGGITSFASHILKKST